MGSRSFADWAAARRARPELLTEWQVYRMFESRRGAWATFQFLIRQRLLEEGEDVASDGLLVRSKLEQRAPAERRRQRERRADLRPRD